MRYLFTGILALTTVWVLAQPASAGQYPHHLPKTKIKRGDGHFVPVPDEVPHAEDAYVDNRIRDDLIWISKRYDIYVGEGFSGRLPNGDSNCPV